MYMYNNSKKCWALMKVPSARIGGALFMGGCQVIIHKAKPWTIVGSVLRVPELLQVRPLL